MQSTTSLAAEYATFVREGELLAGGLTDLAQRATVYHHMFAHSGGNHVFPLIAAHGALWARGYFRFGMRLGEYLSWQYGLDLSLRRQKLLALAEFADAFRDVNRRVCADTYATYHFTARYGESSGAADFVSPELLEASNRMHAATRSGRELDDYEKRQIFEAFFLNEQALVVGPRISAAVERFDWPALKWIALQPIIRFAYFPFGRTIRFSNFANRDERIANGLRAFDYAACAGWQQSAAALRHYDVLPDAFFFDSLGYFSGLRTTVLAGT